MQLFLQLFAASVGRKQINAEFSELHGLAFPIYKKFHDKLYKVSRGNNVLVESAHFWPYYVVNFGSFIEHDMQTPTPLHKSGQNSKRCAMFENMFTKM